MFKILRMESSYTLEKAENGWILYTNDKPTIHLTLTQALEYIKDNEANTAATYNSTADA